MQFVASGSPVDRHYTRLMPPLQSSCSSISPRAWEWASGSRLVSSMEASAVSHYTMRVEDFDTCGPSQVHGRMQEVSRRRQFAAEDTVRRFDGPTDQIR
jgi:hypothetical protein